MSNSYSSPPTLGSSPSPSLISPWCFFKGSEDLDITEDLETQVKELAERKAVRFFCWNCGSLITSGDSLHERNGQIAHTFANPLGVVFRIACFWDAPGCKPEGQPTGDFSWFPGYLWNLANCAMCAGHLGWCFHSGKSGFWGLCLSRLRPE